jgi:hypothetical protein
MIEGTFDIRIKDELRFSVDRGENRFFGIMTGAARAKTIAVNPKQRSHPLCSASEPCVLISPHTAPQ